MGELTKIIKRVAGIVGEDAVKTDPAVTTGHAVDGVSPGMVVFPRDMEEIAQVVLLANQEGLVILPWGSGSKVATGYAPGRLDLVVCTSRLNAITDMDTANLTVTVEAGVKFRDVQLSLRSEGNRCYLPIGDPGEDRGESIGSDRARGGCFSPMDPPFIDTTTVGGLIAANASGPRRLLYGLPRDMVLGLKFVAPGGAMVVAGGKTVKNVSGYDVSKLMIGSRGTLGILCEATLRLLPLPERMETLFVRFDSFSRTSLFVEKIFESQLLPAALEVIDAGSIKVFGLKDHSGLDSKGYLVAVALEDFQEPVERMQTEMTEIGKELGGHCEAPLRENDHKNFWISVSNLVTSLSKRFNALITARLNYPVSEWKEIIPFSEKTLAGAGIENAILAHAGSGVCSIHLLLDGKDKEAVERSVRALDMIYGECQRVGGNLVIQRAPAGQKGSLPVWGETRPDLMVMKRIKEQLDPSGVMCPGRFVGKI